MFEPLVCKAYRTKCAIGSGSIALYMVFYLTRIKSVNAMIELTSFALINQ